MITLSFSFSEQLGLQKVGSWLPPCNTEEVSVKEIRSVEPGVRTGVKLVKKVIGSCPVLYRDVREDLRGFC